MAYADADYYNDTYLGHAAPDDDTLTRYLQRASDDIDAVCINGIDTDDLEADALDYLKKATCARAEQYVMAGTDDPDESTGSLGAFSISNSEGATPAGGIPLNVRCKMFLVRTGLMNRSIGKIRYETYTS